MRSIPVVFAIVLGLSSFPVLAASLVELMNSVPPPPTSVGDALAWKRGGDYINPAYLAFKQQLAAEKAEIAALNGGTAPVAATPVEPDSASTPEVKRALRAYDSYLDSIGGKNEPKAALAKRTRWVQAAYGMKQANISKAMTPCEAPCQDPSEIAANQPLLAKRDEAINEELKIWAVLFEDWSKEHAAVVAEGQSQIERTQNGALATTQPARSGVAAYRAAMIREIELTLSISELAVERAVAIETGIGIDAVSGATAKQSR